MRVQSDQALETYPWLGNAPAMREFIGGRTPKELRENSFTISNKDYEGSIRIQSEGHAARQSSGMIQIRINQLADRALDHPAKLLSSLIISGESTACYDGQYFFDTDHAEGDSGSQSNDITSGATSTTAPTVAEFSAAVMKTIGQIYSIKDDRGEPNEPVGVEVSAAGADPVHGPWRSRRRRRCSAPAARRTCCRRCAAVSCSTWCRTRA